MVAPKQKLAKGAFVAARKDDVGRLSECIKVLENVNLRDEYGLTLLMWAARKNSCQVGKFLLEMSADINLSDCTGRTALFHAAEFGKTEFASLLIDAGADLNHRNNWGNSALRVSRAGGYPQTYRVIRSKMVAMGVVLDEDPDISELPPFKEILGSDVHEGERECDLETAERRLRRIYKVSEPYVIDCFESNHQEDES